MQNSTDWPALDTRHVWHPYTQMHTAPTPLPIARAEGAYLYTTTGEALLDGISSWWVNLHGHNVPRLNQALADQASRMAHVMFAGCTQEPGARLAASLAERSGLPHVFYSDNGSTAVEVAMKMAYQAWHNRGQGQRTLFVAFDGAYHGDTFGAMAASSTSLFHGVFAELLFQVRRAHGAVCPAGDGGPCAASCPHSLTAILEREGDNVAAVLVEPLLQGAGGMIVWPVQQLRAVADACTAHGIPLIADEVFTGFGRTGSLFACEQAGVRPNLLCLSKAITAGYLPLGATLADSSTYEAFLSGDRGRTFFHGHSFTANPLACAVAVESLALFDDNRVLERVARLDTLYAEFLPRMAALPAVQSTRHIGCVAVMELHAPSAGYLSQVGPTLAARFLQRGILLRPLGNVLYFLPPMCITDSEVKHVFGVIAEVLTET